MGVGGGFEANEPGGERIVSLAALCVACWSEARQPLPSRERVDSGPERLRVTAAAPVTLSRERYGCF